MNRIIAVVIGIVVLALLASTMIFIVDPRSMAVLTARGGGSSTLVGPGLHFKLPIPLQTMTRVDIRVQTLDTMAPQRYTTSEQDEVLVQPLVRYRVTDARQYVLAMADKPSGVGGQLEPLVTRALTDALAKHTFDDALAKQRTIAEAVQQTLQKAVAAFGVEIVAVQMLRFDPAASTVNAINQRMADAYQQLAQQERAQSAADVEKAKADAVREQQMILANAYQSVQTITGAGEAEAASIAADAFGHDLPFYQFYASLQAYRSSFKPNDIIVVDPDSAFFRFMRSPSGGADTVSTPSQRR